MGKSRVTRDPENRLVPVKVPAWMHRMALQVSSVTDEELGEIFVRLAGEGLHNDFRTKVLRSKPKSGK